LKLGACMISYAFKYKQLVLNNYQDIAKTEATFLPVEMKSMVNASRTNKHFTSILLQ
jgi:hypothetical protein